MSKQKVIALQATDAFSITPHNTDTISTQTSGKYDFCTLYIGGDGSGNLTVVTAEGTQIQFTGVTKGFFPVNVKQVLATGTDVTGIIGLTSKYTIGN